MPGAAGARAGLAGLLVLWAALLAMPGMASATSLRFHGNGTGGIDRVKIRIDGPATPADIGSSDFTLEWWMRALPGENTSDDVACNTNDGWIFGNIIFDRDIFGGGEHGDYGVSLTSGRLAFGVSAGSAGNTICGAIVVADGEWHHVAVTRQRSTGQLRIYVDGVLDAEGAGGTGPDKDVSYQNGRTTDHPDSDPFLVIGAEKHDAGAAYPSYSGWIDEVRLSTVRRYTGARFTRPFSAFTVDGNTAALYHLDEGAGNAIGDALGGSPGTRQFGGSPAGPEWSSDSAPLDTARRVALEQVIQGLSEPVTIANAGDDRIFVVEKGGRIQAYKVTENPPFEFLGTYLDIHGRVDTAGERGLLGLAFHPAFATNGYFFVYYVRNGGGSLTGDLVIARYQAGSATATSVDPNTEKILLTIEHSDQSNHNGGGIAFGPDGRLYAPVGDGGGGGDPSGNGQKLTTHLGKILRFAVSTGSAPPFYAIPSDNPFSGSTGSEKQEIWALGLRNPWRIGFDRVAGDLIIADVGQGDREEIDFQLAGSAGGVNYGWSRMEGIACYPPGASCSTTGITLPIMDYTHSEGCSVTGGYRYRGQGIPSLNGVYVFGDYCRGTIWGGVQSADGTTWTRSQLLASGLSISTFGEDGAGELYVAHLPGGIIYRFVPMRPRLTVTKSGNGIGSVAGPGGLSCGSTCSVDYEPGALVDLAPAPGSTSWLAGWSGACGGTGSCAVLMDGDRTVTATFNLRPVFQFSAPSYSVSEGSGSVTITVQRLGTTTGTATVAYKIEAGTATAGADFTGPLAGTLTFTPGQSTRTFSIPIVNDTQAEGPETILLSLHHPTGGGALGAQPTAVVTIVNNDTAGVLKWSASAYSASESSAKVILTATRSGGVAGNVTVDYAIANGSATAGVDFTIPAPPQRLTFAANVMSRTLEIPIVKLDGIEPNQTFTVTLQNPQGGATVGSPAVATVTIVDSDRAGTVQFSKATATAQEFDPTVALTVTRTGPTGGAADVAYEVTGATALVVPADRAGTVHFGQGQGTKSLVLRLQADSSAGGNSALTVALKAPITGGLALGAPNPATVTVMDDDGRVQFSAPTFTISEGNGSATITLKRTGGLQKAVTVTYATGAAGDSATPAATPGACSAGADYRPITNGSLTFNPGQTSRTFSVQLCGDGIVETPNPETLTLRLVGVTAPATLGTPSTAVLQIQENDGGGTVRFSSSAYSVTEGTGTATLTLLRTGGSAGGVTVPWHLGGTAVAGTDYVVPTLMSTPLGASQSTASLPIQILNDSLVDGTRTLVVTLDPPAGGATLGSPSAATLSINDNEPSVRFSSAVYNVNESSIGVVVTVLRGGSTGSTVTLNVKTTTTGTAEGGAGPCGAGIDFTTATLPVTFNPGDTSKSVTVPLCPDTVVDGLETVGLVLANVAGATLGAPNTATIQIAENDVGGTVQFAAAAKSVMEPGAATDVDVLVSRAGGSASGVTAHWKIVGGTAVSGTDYTAAASGTLTFGLNDMSEAFKIKVQPRPGLQGPRSIQLLLDTAGGGGSLGAQTTATLWILDAD